jgi:predicted RNase H-like HicB family nuclease
MKAIEDYLAQNYRTSVCRDEDGDYVVEVDDLPGCMSHGSTPDEAFQNLEEAKRAWMESRVAAGLQIPEPRQTEEYSGRILLRMPRWLHRRLAVQARVEGVSLNQHVVSLLSDTSARQELAVGATVQGAAFAYYPSAIQGVYCQGLDLLQPAPFEVRRVALSQEWYRRLGTSPSQGPVQVVNIPVSGGTLHRDPDEDDTVFPGA